ncbi:MAG: GNAT family N-acetyltransferase [Planctomycetaceae bacterium]|nr:GNAT family N-acetyltransferase [Planctomycetaceae bacterium]
MTSASVAIGRATPESVVVQPVATKAQQNQFVRFPFKLYAQDPCWVPPLEQNLRELLGFAKHPFAAMNPIQTFLAYQNGEVVGRIAGIVDNGFNRRYNDSKVMFGFFESIPDQTVANALFAAVQRWGAEQGMTSMRGPLNPSLNHETGLLVDGFDKSPTFMMTYNPRYYEQLVTGFGFEKVQDLYAFWGHVDMLKTLDSKMKFVVDEAQRRFNVHVRPIDKRYFARDVAMFMDIYNKSLPGTWGFVPMTDAELKHAATGLKHLIVPELSSIAEIDGKAVGVVFALPDYNPRIRAIRGKLYPFGFIRLLWNRQAIKKVRMISTNVLPEYQKWGLGLVLLNHLIPTIHKWGVQEAEFSWVLESNHLSRATLERGGAIREKTYRIYDLIFR